MINSYLRKLLKCHNGILVYISLLTSLFITGCSDLVIRGNNEDIFGSTSVKNITIPSWVYLFGMIIYTIFLSKTYYESVKSMKYKNKGKPKSKITEETRKIRSRKFNEWFVVSVLAIAFCLSSILGEIMGSKSVFMVFNTLHMGLFLSSIYFCAKRIGEYTEDYTGEKPPTFDIITEIFKYLADAIFDKLKATTIKEDNPKKEK